MLFKQGDVAAKLEKKSELYKTFPHFYKMKSPPTIRILIGMGKLVGFIR